MDVHNMVPPERDVQVCADALHRVLESRTFAGAPKARDLLSYVVTETLAGRGGDIKERMVARIALGRPASIDTRTDASGRVHVSRVRERLDRYYAEEGVTDPVRISIPRGQYAAVFTANSAPADAVVPASLPLATDAATSSTRGPALAVVSLKAGGGSGRDRRAAIGLTESLVRALTRFPGLRVIGPLNPRPNGGAEPDVVDIGRRSGADVVLFGRVRESEGQLRLTVHLAEPVAGEVWWSVSLDASTNQGAFGAEDELVAKVVGEVGDYRGVILRREGSAPTWSGGDPRVHDALARYYAFLDDLEPGAGEEAKLALRGALAIEPRNPLLMASLGFLYAVDVIMRGARLAADSLACAEELGRRALAVDPASAQGHAVLAVVTLAKGDLVSARAHAESVVDLAPYHPSLGYLAGLVMAGAGDWGQGIALIRRLVELDPYRPSHRRTLLAVDHLMRDDTAAALGQASQIDFPAYLYGALLRAVCYADLGLEDAARAAMAELVALHPDIFERPEDILGTAPTLPPDVVTFLAGRVAALHALSLP